MPRMTTIDSRQDPESGLSRRSMLNRSAAGLGVVLTGSMPGLFGARAAQAAKPGEIGYGPDESDAVVIWQNRGNPHPCPAGDPDAPVTIVTPGMRVEIGSSA